MTALTLIYDAAASFYVLCGVTHCLSSGRRYSSSNARQLMFGKTDLLTVLILARSKLIRTLITDIYIILNRVYKEIEHRTQIGQTLSALKTQCAVIEMG